MVENDKNIYGEGKYCLSKRSEYVPRISWARISNRFRSEPPRAKALGFWSVSQGETPYRPAQRDWYWGKNTAKQIASLNTTLPCTQSLHDLP